MRLIVFRLVAAAMALAPAIAVAKDRPVVIELFTSQGCSSCPPADRLLTELAADPDVLPLAFHVTYWNSLGWRDVFSLDAATRRQNDYAAHFSENTVFTPQLVVDGAKSVVGSNRDDVTSAIRAAKASAEPTVTISVKRGAGAFDVHVGPGRGHGRLWLVGFDHQHRTTVGRGENSGATLIESNIVRAIREIGVWTGEALALAEQAPAGEDAAILLQAEDGRIIGAARFDGPS